MKAFLRIGWRIWHAWRMQDLSTCYPLALPYSKVDASWVGTEIDTGIALAPGKPLQKKDAILVLAAAIADLLTKE